MPALRYESFVKGTTKRRAVKLSSLDAIKLMLCMNTLEGVIIKCKYGLEIKTLIQLIGNGFFVIEGSFNPSGWKISLHNTRAFGNDILQ